MFHEERDGGREDGEDDIHGRWQACRGEVGFCQIGMFYCTVLKKCDLRADYNLPFLSGPPMMMPMSHSKPHSSNQWGRS
jgi:hypothetical protein